jgi:dTDP-4-amino-4,6-dideoxygalactose transaminase
MNIDPQQIEKKITARTKVILPVHFGGLPCDMDAITDIAASHQLQVIEDCAHAVEASYRGRPAGTLGDYGCFSFYATKSVTSGEGGMVLAKDADKMQRLRIMSLHGMSRDAWNRFSGDGYLPYQVGELGFKYNMMDLQAAIGLQQLQRMQAMWERRHVLWRRYQEGLADTSLLLPREGVAGGRRLHPPPGPPRLHPPLSGPSQCRVARRGEQLPHPRLSKLA